MPADEKLDIAKEGVDNGSILTFRGIFRYATRTQMAELLGMNYSRFSKLVDDPGPLRYDESKAIAKILKVDHRKISELIHNQLERPEQD